MKRAGLLIPVVLTLIVAVAAAFFFQSKKDQPNEAVSTVTVQRSTIEDVVTAQGKLESKQYVDVGAQVSGQLKKLYFDIGDLVKKGDLLAELDPRIYNSKVQADNARIKSLEAQIVEQAAQIQLATQQYQRNLSLIKSKAVSRDVLEISDATLKVAQALALSLKSQLDEQHSTLDGDTTNLSYTKIFAPMNGTVVVEDVREGQTLNSIQQAPIILRLADLDIMTVRAQVAEADVMRLKPGMDVYFSTLGALDRKWHGTLRQILPTPEVVNDVVLYNALVDVNNSNQQLMTGMSTQMFFVLQRAENVLSIPINALGKLTNPNDTTQSDRYQVQKLENGKVVDVSVRVGLSNRNTVEVREGLSEGDQILSKKNKPSSFKPVMMGPRL